eukprot:6192147-Pleurochrysis_carterae.AAC.6
MHTHICDADSQAWFASFLASAKMLVRHRLDAAPVDNPVHPSRCKFCEVPCVSSPLFDHFVAYLCESWAWVTLHRPARCSFFCRDISIEQVLIASVLKAARVRRKLRAIRKERAIRRIVLAIRAYVARLRVRRLQQKHAAGAVAVASLWHHVRSKPQKDTLIRPNLSAPTCLWSLDAQTRGSTRNANGSRRTRALENLKEMPYEFETESVASPSPSPRPLLASHAKSAEVERAGYISGSTESSEDAARELSTCD